MTERNPPLAVDLTIQSSQIMYNVLDVLTFSGMLRSMPESDYSEKTRLRIYAPKYVTNYNNWADAVKRYAEARGFDAEIVRP
jgi:hypothetical protein